MPHRRSSQNFARGIHIMAFISGLLSPQLQLTYKDAFLFISIIILRLFCLTTTLFYAIFYMQFDMKHDTNFFSRFILTATFGIQVLSVVTTMIVGLSRSRKIKVLLWKILKMEDTYPVLAQRRSRKIKNIIVSVTFCFWLTRLLAQVVFVRYIEHTLVMFLYDTSTKVIESFFATSSAVLAMVWYKCKQINTSLKQLSNQVETTDDESDGNTVERLCNSYVGIIQNAEEFNDAISVALLPAYTSFSVGLFYLLYHSFFIISKNDILSAFIPMSFFWMISAMAHITIMSVVCQMVTVESKRVLKTLHEVTRYWNNQKLITKVKNS